MLSDNEDEDGAWLEGVSSSYMSAETLMSAKKYKYYKHIINQIAICYSNEQMKSLIINVIMSTKLLCPLNV